MQEEFITLEPGNEQLKKYISCYYFHRSFYADFRKQFIFYPNYNHALTVYKNAHIVLGSTSSTVYSAPNEKLSIIYSNNLNTAAIVTLNGVINKIGIVFRPLGINHFIEKSLNKTINGYCSVGVEFLDLGTDFEEALSHIYEELDPDKKVALLDLFFLKKKNAFDQPALYHAVDSIIQSGGTAAIKEITDELNISGKTVLRLFQKHLACSVADFKKLVKFRNTMNSALNSPQFKTLTELALNNQYYDQADFINQFKNITGLTPKSFFSQVSELGKHGIYWNIKKMSE